jgi:hypothetical protein
VDFDDMLRLAVELLLVEIAFEIQGLLHCHAFCQVAWLIDISPPTHGSEVGKEL